LRRSQRQISGANRRHAAEAVTMTKPHERVEARRLRREGMSLKDIAKLLGVAKASVSVWVRDIPLTDEQNATLRDKYHHYDAKIKGSRANFQKGLEQRIAYQQEGRAKAREGDSLHLAGCMLYWAEGSKSRASLELVNSDPDMLSFFIKFLRESLCVSETKLSARIICYTNNGVSIQEIESYWLNKLSLQRTALRKTTDNAQPKSSQQRGRKLMYGVCVLSVHSVKAKQHVYGALQEYIGIDKPEWVL
ncbi:MAG: hypothetical protein ABI835_05480, partial [Chloroflexota bacterium]